MVRPKDIGPASRSIDWPGSRRRRDRRCGRGADVVRLVASVRPGPSRSAHLARGELPRHRYCRLSGLWLRQPNGPIDRTSPLADITAYPAGILTDGYGLGGYGLGGFGRAASTYSWTSDALTAGTWNFAIAPYDEAGNQGAAQMTSVTISVPPLAPAPFADGTRAHYSYNPMAAIATITWNASPT